ncbi:phosphotransferase [Micromonospora kangleipakensis]|uniref:phosphotransferase n=1 Tax=Micromonospora kangleipakensis TaxID=1077942 RepID=UPI0013EF3E4A|nr:phosphotransferase [Micromonospora kangleipakensis]
MISVVFAADLAAFVAAVHDMETGGRTWDGRGRGGPLHTRDAYVRWDLGESTHLTDTARLARTWAKCRDAAPPHDGPDVWLHGDLMPGTCWCATAGWPRSSTSALSEPAAALPAPARPPPHRKI